MFAGICWDQWFPEAARAMVLQGAEILFYPTAIGSEPQDDGLDSRDHWKRVMQGHAGANLVHQLMRFSTKFQLFLITSYCDSFSCVMFLYFSSLLTCQYIFL